MTAKIIWPYPLRRGNSPHPAQGACLLDAVSWLTYGKLGDHPKCVSPFLASVGRALNDFLPDEPRQRLREFIPLLPNTADRASEFARQEIFLSKCWDIVLATGIWRARQKNVGIMTALGLAASWGTYSGLDACIWTPTIKAYAAAINYAAANSGADATLWGARLERFEQMRRAA